MPRGRERARERLVTIYDTTIRYIMFTTENFFFVQG
jgi:hypothetical protein